MRTARCWASWGRAGTSCHRQSPYICPLLSLWAPCPSCSRAHWEKGQWKMGLSHPTSGSRTVLFLTQLLPSPTPSEEGCCIFNERPCSMLNTPASTRTEAASTQWLAGNIVLPKSSALAMHFHTGTNFIMVALWFCLTALLFLNAGL